MNWDEIKGTWKQLRGQVQQRWGKLTNDDLDVIEGKKEELIGRLQKRYGYSKDQAEREAQDFLTSTESGSTYGSTRPRAGNE